MILFESLSFGMLAVFLVLAAVLLLVGVYAQIVWPLTDWDLVGFDLDTYLPLVNTALLAIFAFGSSLGFWFVSGSAFKR